MTEDCLADIPLANISEKEGVPEERLASPKDLRDIYTRYREDDSHNAYNRGLTQDLLDGGLPYDPSNLAENGVDMTNVNFGGAEQQLERARRPYYKLIQSPEKLVSVTTLFGSEDERHDLNEILSEEVSRTIRGFDGFEFETAHLCGKFIWDGLGFAYWSDSRDFRYRAAGLGQFFFARGTVPLESRHEVIPMIDEFELTRLYGFIRNEASAERSGWNPEAVKRAISKARSNQPDYMDWEKWKEEIKNNDLSIARQKKVRIVHGFVKEFDGTVSHYMTTEEDCSDSGKPESWLYRRRGKYPSMSSALVMFPYGLGTNSKIHGIRGLGYKIYAFEQQRNRSLCRLIDQGMIASSVMLKAKDASSYNDAPYQTIGNASVLAPEIDIANASMPDLQRSVMPALSEMERLRNDRIAGYTGEGVLDGDQRKTKYEIQASLEQHAALSDVEQDFFYKPLERALRETVRRMIRRGYVKTDPGGEDIAALKERLARRGVPLEALYRIDVDAVQVVKLIGAGSASAKTLALQRMGDVYPRLDDVGKDNYDRDYVVDAVGSANADRYKPVDRTPRTVYDTSIAILQNNDLLEGKEVPVLPTDKHMAQAREHIKPLVALYEAYQTRQLDGEGQLAAEAVRHRLLYQHTAEHVAAIQGDPAVQEEAAAYRQSLQQIGEIIGNGLKEAERMAGEGGEDGAPAGGGPTPEQIAQLEDHRAKMRRDQDAWDLKQRIMVEEAETKMRIADAEAANRIRNSRRVKEASGKPPQPIE